jgi:hypothetical protein
MIEHLNSLDNFGELLKMIESNYKQDEIPTISWPNLLIEKQIPSKILFVLPQGI